MLAVQIVILIFILLVIPTVVGTIFRGRYKESAGLPFYWVSGQILLWAGFLLLSIPLILKEKPFSLLVTLFGTFMVTLTVISFCRLGSGLRKCSCCIKNTKLKKEKGAVRITDIVAWMVFGVLLIVQLVLMVVMAYEEGDDAFYVATSTVTEASDTMYRILPYTGLTTGLDARHGLAPFPIWVAFLARVSGMHPATVSQIALPVVLVVMAYGIYYLIAQQLFEDDKKKCALFMIVAELSVIFGGYSVYSAENFLIVRASQGKAVLANIVLPFLLYLMMVLMKKLQNREIMGGMYWMLTALTMLAGCLCSTLGSILTCMFLGVVGLCTAFAYKKWRILLPMAGCCVIPMGVALLYFML